MHHFHAITQTVLLFHESRPEKRVNQAITPTAGGASIVYRYYYVYIMNGL